MKISVAKFTILVIAAVLSAAVTVAALCLTGAGGEFVPPPFESGAVPGVPGVPASLGYGEIYRDGMSYRFSVCGNVTLNGEEAAVYLTNPAESGVWLKLRVLDGEGKTLGETGLLRPGEYVENVRLAKELPVGTAVTLKIMGYEPETYHSVGAVTIRTVIGVR